MKTLTDLFKILPRIFLVKCHQLLERVRGKRTTVYRCFWGESLAIASIVVFDFVDIGIVC